MRIAVTGRSGQLAQSLAERAQGSSGRIEIVNLARPDFDLEAIGAIASAVGRAAPDIVVNAAAYTAVDEAENDADRALLVNGAAAGALASACAARGIAIVQISTDYVFDGTKSGPYVETDPTCPINVYGASKVLGEQLVAKANPRHIIVRTSSIVSPFGTNFVRTMLRLAADRDRLDVADDQQTVPTYAPHLAETILRIATEMIPAKEPDPRWGIYNIANRGEATWCGVARKIFDEASQSGMRVPVVAPIPGSACPTPARRPANARLDCSKLERNFGVVLPSWQDAIAACVARLLPPTQRR